MTIKTIAQERALDSDQGDSGSDSEAPSEEPDVVMQKKLKSKFIEAAENESDSDGLLQVKPKTEAQIKEEKDEKEEDDALKEFWGKNQDQLSKDDQFLRDYILKQAWKKQPDIPDKKKDNEDDNREDEIDQFERAYNF